MRAQIKMSFQRQDLIEIMNKERVFPKKKTFFSKFLANSKELVSQKWCIKKNAFQRMDLKFNFEQKCNFINLFHMLIIANNSKRRIRSKMSLQRPTLKLNFTYVTQI